MTREEEEWSRRIIELELKRIVVLHDTGSSHSMYDLRIGSIDSPDVAIECVGAVDPVFIKTWKFLTARGSLQLSVSGDWIISIASKARLKGIEQLLERLLKELEDRGIDHLYVDHRLKWQDTRLFNELRTLDILQLDRYVMEGTGKISFHVQPDESGGAVDEHGSSVPEWIGGFLRHSDRQDVLKKLIHSQAAECHVFIFATFSGVPWSVYDYLSRSLDNLPINAPDLPSPVSNVWISGSGEKGIRWDGTTWRRFVIRGEGH
jgi:hypothetical protein